MTLFRPARTVADIADVEEETRRFWEERDIFQKSVARRAGGKPWVWHDGPPTANGRPHNGHVLTRVFKDVFPRFHTMRGRYAERIAGWDTHGLPVEVEVEKELGIHGRAGIEEYGVGPFVEKCMASVFRYIRDWEEMTARIGHWVDLDHAYVTYRRSYVESVWWALAELHRKGLLYRGEKVVWWWAQGGTALSSAEVGLGYREVDDPAVYVTLPLVDDPGLSLVVWTTTPWTLPSNLYAAVRPGTDYVEVEDTPAGGATRRLVVAAALREDLAGRLGRALPVRRAFPGEELVGRRYRPPFDDFWNRHHALAGRLPGGGSVPAFWRVLPADFVELDQGTGLVHEAPAFGEVDHDLHRKTVSAYENADEIPLPCAIGPDGRFTAEVPWLEGQWVKAADKAIVRRLREEGRLLHHETIRHEYPFCWRSDQDPLIQYARPAWFIRTTARKDAALANSGAVNWLPEHIREGRFGDFLRNNVDWALSRERFWGTPLNIWINDATGRLETPASVAEIEAKNPDAFAAFRKARAERPDLDPDLLVHKPWVDEVTWTNPGEPGVYRRVPEVIDCWFDSGAMPFAQWGFPHQNRDRFRKAFPADYIVEAVDQTRGWFYSLLMISTLLFDEDTCGRLGLPAPDGPHPYRSCLVLGHVTDPEGRKESKSRGNYTPPEETLAEVGADAFRWFFLTSTVPWANKRHSLQNVRAAAREFPLELRNVYSFFTIYAEIDGFDPRTDRGRPVPERAALDRWILSHLEETTAAVTGGLEECEPNDQIRGLEECEPNDQIRGLEEIEAYGAARSLAAFTDSLSNWWLRRSRRRFWEAGRGAEKLDAYRTLYDVLVRISKLAAPFVPFLAEEIHRNLVAGPFGDEEPESVHLTDWPEREFPLDSGLNEEMAAVREIASLGLRVRNEQKIRVRQPLATASVAVAEAGLRARLGRHRDLIADELNVREVRFREDPEADMEFVVKPNFRRLGPRLGGRMQVVRMAMIELDGRKVRNALAHGSRQYDLVVPGPEGKPVAIELKAHDVEIESRPREGHAIAGSPLATVALDTVLTPELLAEGRYRELLNRVQRFRKDLNLPYVARIRVGLEVVKGESSLVSVVREREQHFLEETLAVEFSMGRLSETSRLSESLATSVARKGTARKGGTRKGAARKRVTRKKATRKKMTRKKMARQRTTRGTVVRAVGQRIATREIEIEGERAILSLEVVSA